MVAALSGTVPWQEDTLYCYFIKNMRVVRPPVPETSLFRQDWKADWKAFMPHSTYPFLTYPDFCLGWIWAAKPATLNTLLEQVRHTPGFLTDPL